LAIISGGCCSCYGIKVQNGTSKWWLLWAGAGGYYLGVVSSVFELLSLRLCFQTLKVLVIFFSKRGGGGSKTLSKD